MTGIANGDIREGHGFTHWWTMFNPRQLLVHSQLLRAINTVDGSCYQWELREFVLGAFQQYLRNQCMFAFWHLSHDHFAPALSNNNFHSKSTLIEVGVFLNKGYGPWPSTIASLVEAAEWANIPLELVSNECLQENNPWLRELVSGKSEKISCGDPVQNGATLACNSSTDLSSIPTASYDLVITDPPFPLLCMRWQTLLPGVLLNSATIRARSVYRRHIQRYRLHR
jgi:hypothetical protein